MYEKFDYLGRIGWSWAVSSCKNLCANSVPVSVESR